FARVAQPLALRALGDLGGAAIPWLALLGLASPVVRRAAPTVRWWRWLATAAVGGVFALGPALSIGSIAIPLPGAPLPYSPLRWLKAGGRLVGLWQVGVAGLAAEGAAVAVDAVQSASLRGLVGAALVAGAALPAARPLADRPRTALPLGADVPAVYRWLAT